MSRKPKTDGDHYYDPFPQRLRYLIEECNLKQEDLVPVLNIKSRQSVTGYIDGSTVPTSEKISALASFFDVSADYLLGLQDDPTNDTDMKAVCQFTGLSSSAIEELRFFKRRIGYSSILNELLSGGAIRVLLTNLLIIKDELNNLQQFLEQNGTDYDTYSNDDITAFNSVTNDLAVKVNIRLPNLVKDIPVKVFGYDPEMQDRINDKLAEAQLKKTRTEAKLWREAQAAQTEIDEESLNQDQEEREAENGKQHTENN